MKPTFATCISKWMRSLAKTVNPCRVSLLAVFFLAITCLARGQAVKWTGGAAGNWNVPANWSTGKVPNITNDVSLDVNASTVITYDKNDKGPLLNSLSCSAPANMNITLTPKPNISIGVAAMKDITIGANCTIKGQDNAGTDPFVEIISSKGNITVGGTVIGGIGQSFAKGQLANGGHVEISSLAGTTEISQGGLVQGGAGGPNKVAVDPPGIGGKASARGNTLKNLGRVLGGQGGDNRFGGTGGTGGDYDLSARGGGPNDVFRPGNRNVGAGGKGPPDGQTGHGSESGGSAVPVSILPGDTATGDTIVMIESGPGPISMQGVLTDAYNAPASVTIQGGTDGQGNVSTIDLTGIPSGTTVFNSPNVCVAGNIMLDPGVTLSSLAPSGATVVTGDGITTNCISSVSSPTLPEWAAIIMVLALVSLSIFRIRRSQSAA